MKITNNNMILSLVAVLALGGLVGCGGSSETENTAASVAQYVPAGWYMSTKVSVYDSPVDKTYQSTNPAVFGKLTGSSDGFDKNDIRTLGSVVNRKAAVVFVQNEWEERSGEYHSNYHENEGESGNWEFTVFSSVPNAEITLKWDGLYKVTSLTVNGHTDYKEKKVLDGSTLENLHLVDTKTSGEIDAVTDGKLNTYVFNIGDAKSRTFRWVEGSVDTNSVAASSATMKYIESKQKEEAVKASILSSSKSTNAHPKFGLPPK